MFFYQAHTDCELYIIGKHDFQSHLGQDHDFTLRMINILSNAYVNANLQVDALVQTTANLKLLYTFRHLCLRYGRDIKDDTSQLQIPLTQQELANYTGLTRETTTIELNKLKKNGIVSYKHQFYTINTKRVNELIEDEYNPGLNTSSQTATKNFIL